MNETVALLMEFGAMAVRARIAESQARDLLAQIEALNKRIAELEAAAPKPAEAPNG